MFERDNDICISKADSILKVNAHLTQDHDSRDTPVLMERVSPSSILISNIRSSLQKIK